MRALLENGNLIDLIKNQREKRDRGIIFIDRGKEEFYSYNELYTDALRIMSFLRKKGLKPRQKVIFQINIRKDFIRMFWACILGGFIPVPISVVSNEEIYRKLFNVWTILESPYIAISSTKIKQEIERYAMKNGLEEIVKEMMERNVIVSEISLQHEKELPSEAESFGTALIQFSSGSTGDPKGVVLTHENLVTNINSMTEGAKVTPDDSSISWLPLTHDMGLIGFHLVPLAIGVNQYQMPTKLFIRNPVLWMKKVSENRISILSSPNFGYKHFLAFFNKQLSEDIDLSCVRLIFNGAEPISSRLCSEFLDTLEKYKLKRNSMFPVYGLAEACLAVSFPPVDEEIKNVILDRNFLSVGQKVKDIDSCSDEGATFVDVGQAVDGTEIKITDLDNNMLPDETIGYIQIKGKNVTKCYYKNVEATQKAISKSRWLNTGDLGFVRNDRLVITGRAKDVIFSNGQNYYSHDIERVAQGVEGFQLNEVVAAGCFNEKIQEDELILFILAKKRNYCKLSANVQKLKQHISFKIGINVHRIVPVSKIPKTTSGKIQRYKLKEEYLKGKYDLQIMELTQITSSQLENEIIEGMQSEIEKKLLEICKEVLKTKKIDLQNNFFELGGDSLKASILVTQINQSFGIDIQPSEIFIMSTIKELVAYIEESKGEINKKIPTVEEKEYYQLSTAQKSIYALSQLEENSSVYNIPIAVQISNELDIHRVEKVFNQLIMRHESLRTEFKNINGEIVQKIQEVVKFKLQYIEGVESSIGDIAKKMDYSFDLSKAPLLRVGLVKVCKDRYFLLLNIHHIIGDGTSAIILLKEFFELYSSRNLPRLRIQYKDFAEWQYDISNSERMRAQEDYWLHKFTNDIPILDLPTDYLRPQMQSYEGSIVKFKVDSELTSKIKRIAQENEATLYMFLLTAYSTLLYRYTNQEDIIVGTPIAGRQHLDLQNVIGLFVNTLAMRNRPTGNKTFKAFLLEVKENAFEAYKNQSYSFETLVEKLNIKRDMTRNPLFDTMFMLQNLDYESVGAEDSHIEYVDIHNNTSKFDITLSTIEKENTLEFTLEYCTSLFRLDTINQFKNSFLYILYEVVKNPEVKLSEINVLSNKEQRRLVYELNSTIREYPKNRTICQLFEDQVKKTPDKIAVIYENEKLTYKELNQRANSLAFILRENGVRANTVVGLMLNQSIEMIVAILGVLKAGGAYLPIDLTYPEERVKYILEDSGARYLLTDDHLVVNGKSLAIHRKDLYHGMRHNMDKINSPTDLCYIIYTSGTTGNPKGVMIEHVGVVNYICWASKKYVRNENVNFPLYTSISFDLTVTSIFTPLITGNSIVIYRYENGENIIERIIKDNNVGAIKLTPSHLKLIRGKKYEKSNVKRLILGGEDLQSNLARDIYDSFDEGIEIYNEYGPTETVVGCMIHKFNPVNDVRKSVPIGVPIDNTQIHILDKHYRSVPKGVKGEIYVSGDGVGRGYLNREALTREKFISNPFMPGQKMYKTGDLARMLPDERIEFLGRVDNQVKIRGFRIELGEIELLLSKHDSVKEAVITAETDDLGNKSLCAYVVLEEQLFSHELRRYLTNSLPEYMIPSFFIEVDEIPLTSNGKADKRALQSIGKALNTDVEYIPPKNHVERTISKIWEDVLGVNQVGMKDNFIDLGGDSIKATQISARLNNQGINIAVKDILSYQTIEQIVINVDLMADRKQYTQEIITGEKQLTPIDRWFFTQNFNNPSYYNQSVLLQFKKQINITVLKAAFKKLIEHHDGLRLNFDEKEQTLYFNNNHLKEDFKIDTYDISNIEEDKKSDKIHQICTEARKSLDLANSLLLKAVLIKLDGSVERLFITAHHIVIDGVSWRILLEDLYTVYKVLEQGKEVVLPKKTAPLSDWHKELVRYSEINQLESEREYWNEIEEFNFALPSDYEVKDWGVNNIDKVDGNLSKEDTSYLLKESYKIYNTDVVTLLIVSLAKALKSWVQEDTFIIELENHGRHIDNIDVSRTIGWFTAMHPVKIQIESNNTSEQIMSIKEQIKGIPNKGIGYGFLKYIKQDFKYDKNTISEIRFNYLGQFDNEAENDLFFNCEEDIGKEIEETNHITAKVEINCMVVNGIFKMDMNYNQKAYDRDTMRGFQELYFSNLKALLQFMRQETEVYFTPSDFDTAGIVQEDLDTILG